MRIIHVTDVTPLEGARLSLSFSDGSRGIADLSSDLAGPLAALREPELWVRAHVEHGAVVWNDDFDLASEFLYARAHDLPAPKTGNDVTSNQVEVTLRQLREMAGVTQIELAFEMGVAQGEVSRVERRTDWKLSTLTRYVESLGGHVEVIANFGDRSMRLHLNGD